MLPSVPRASSAKLLAPIWLRRWHGAAQLAHEKIEDKFALNCAVHARYPGISNLSVWHLAYIPTRAI